MERLLGAHVSIAGGLPTAISEAKRLGCNAIQLFGSSPRVWDFRMPQAKAVDGFKKAAKVAGVKFVVLHSIYLINLATEDQGRRQKATDSLVNYLKLGQLLGADGVVTHIGTATGISEALAVENSATAIKTVLERTPRGIPLILEVTAGSGNTIGSKYEHIAELQKRVGQDARLKVCCDTAHTFEAGYDLVNDLDGVLAMFDKVIGLERLAVIHFNDSKTEFGSKVDRHENLGEGKIGLEAMKRIANHPKLVRVPIIMEVPGFEGDGVDLRNMRLLKQMISPQ